MTVRADLHIHSCLSPCGDLSMSPITIAETAVATGLDLIALTDHNTARNAVAFEQACARAGIACLFGTEVTTAEEAHVLALFEDREVAVEFGDMIYRSLPHEVRDPEMYGDQVVVNAENEIIEELESFLIGSSTFGLEEVGRAIHSRGGLYIPAHIDRSQFSIWSQLGFLPDDSYDAVEMVDPASRERIDPGDWPVIANSDAHFPDAIGRRSFTFEGEAASFASLKEALEAGELIVYGA